MGLVPWVRRGVAREERVADALAPGVDARLDVASSAPEAAPLEAAQSVVPAATACAAPDAAEHVPERGAVDAFEVLNPAAATRASMVLIAAASGSAGLLSADEAALFERMFAAINIKATPGGENMLLCRWFEGEPTLDAVEHALASLEAPAARVAIVLVGGDAPDAVFSVQTRSMAGRELPLCTLPHPATLLARPLRKRLAWTTLKALSSHWHG